MTFGPSKPFFYVNFHITYQFNLFLLQRYQSMKWIYVEEFYSHYNSFYFMETQNFFFYMICVSIKGSSSSKSQKLRDRWELYPPWVLSLLLDGLFSSIIFLNENVLNKLRCFSLGYLFRSVQCSFDQDTQC